MKTFIVNKDKQKQETELANNKPNIKSKTIWEPKKNHYSIKHLQRSS